ncbi:GSCOCG00011546001-RA-CDS [Cotesia congregata]|nr:GSCOCG00011546001-RA-CDS [Cotesia congregata]
MGRHVNFPSPSFDTNPGRTSISIPTLNKYSKSYFFFNIIFLFTFKTPFKILPPATPPLRSSTSQPGLLTSNDRITIKRGSEVKSRRGTGIFLTMYSQSTSMLYFN